MINIDNKKQDDDSVDNLLKLAEQLPEQTETSYLKNYPHHYQPPQKSYLQSKLPYPTYF